MTSALEAFLSARGQAPLAGYVAAFVERYAPVNAPLAALALVLGVLLAMAAERLLRRREGAVPGPWGGPRALPWLVLAVVVALGFRVVVLGGMPHIPDEATYLFQARLLAEGRATGAVPDQAMVEALEIPFTAVHQGAWVGAFLPGWPAALAAGLRAGVPWLPNLLLLVVALLLIRRWVGRHFGAEVGAVALALGATSPFVVLPAASGMADLLALVGVLAAVVLFEEDLPVPAGFACAVAVLARPASVFFLGGAAAWVCLFDQARRAGAGRVVLGGAPGALFWLAWNKATTGAWLASAYSLAAPAPGFLSGQATYQGMALKHDLVAAATNLGLNVSALTADLLGWPLLSLLPVLGGALACGGWRRGGMLRGGMVGMALGYATYFHPGLAYGPRFYLPAAPWLLGCAAAALVAWARRREAPPGRTLAWFAVGVAPAVVLGYWLPCGLAYARYGGVDPRPAAYVDAIAPPGRLLVVIPDLAYPDRPLVRCFLGENHPSPATRRWFLSARHGPEALRRWAALSHRRLWTPPHRGSPWNPEAPRGGRAPPPRAPAAPPPPSPGR
jgi:hypothetical protein